MKITLPVLFPSDETRELDALGLTTDYDQHEHRPFIFYQINGLVEYRAQGKKYTTILSNGDTYICPLPIAEVEAKVDHEMKMDMM